MNIARIAMIYTALVLILTGCCISVRSANQRETAISAEEFVTLCKAHHFEVIDTDYSNDSGVSIKLTAAENYKGNNKPHTSYLAHKGDPTLVEFHQFSTSNEARAEYDNNVRGVKVFGSYNNGKFYQDSGSNWSRALVFAPGQTKIVSYKGNTLVIIQDYAGERVEMSKFMKDLGY